MDVAQLWLQIRAKTRQLQIQLTASAHFSGEGEQEPGLEFGLFAMVCRECGR